MNDSLEPGHANLKQALKQLPAHEPEEATWARIATQLAMAQAALVLPQHEPDDALWGAIANRLDEAQSVATNRAAVHAPVRQLWPACVAWIASIAATMLLLLGVWWLQPSSPGKQAVASANTPHETITFSEETIPTVATGQLMNTADPLAQQGKAFIDAHCTSLPNVCRSSEFRALRRQLTEVEAQEHRLQQDSQRFGASPELVRQQVQLTSLRATITRELVQLLIS